MSFEISPVDLDIRTLLHPGHSSLFLGDNVNNLVSSYYKPTESSRSTFDSPVKSWWLNSDKFQRNRSSLSESSTASSEFQDEIDVLVNGADIGDLPTEYYVKGLRTYEFPVIGTYVDRHVIPGFKYSVRKLGGKSYLFNGKGLALKSIGMGYGKRITMESESQNSNNNYFYSDTHEEGYGFSIQVLAKGDKFVIYNNDQHAVATATVNRIELQREVDSQIKDNGDIEKTVQVVFTCNVQYEEKSSVTILAPRSITVEGSLLVCKAKRLRKAEVKSITGVNLAHYGECSLEIV